CQRASGAVGPSYTRTLCSITTIPAFTWGPFFKVLPARSSVALIASRGITGRPPERYSPPYHSNLPTSSRSAKAFFRLSVIFLIAWDHWLSGSLLCPLCIKSGERDVRWEGCTCFRDNLVIRRGELLGHLVPRDVLGWRHGCTRRPKRRGRQGSGDLVQGWQHPGRKPEAPLMVRDQVVTWCAQGRQVV